MKKILLFILLLTVITQIKAQDTLRTTTSKEIIVKVLEINKDEIKYKRFDNLDGPDYVISTAEVTSITYANGATDTFSEQIKKTDPVIANNESKAYSKGREYYDWKDEIDYINIVEQFNINQYNAIHIMDFDYSNIYIPEKSDNRYPALVTALSEFPNIVANELNKRFRGIKIIFNEGNQPIGAKDLALELKIDNLDMGSRAARFWVGFGSGAQRMTVSVTVRDASGQNLFNFTHERHSTSGSSYERCLLNEMENFAEDIVIVFRNIY